MWSVAPRTADSTHYSGTGSPRTSALGKEVLELKEIADPVDSIENGRPLFPEWYAGAIVVLVGVGSLSLFPLWVAMYRLWATDALRSIGAVFPLVTCIGILAAWRRLGWGMDGTFWGLPIVVFSILLAHAVSVSAVTIWYNEQHLALIGYGTALFLYGIGAVLLFGGTRLLRASIIPLCLLLFIDPVPHVFNSAVDMPLQHLSASTARSFAHLIGLHPTGVQLRMMFAPDFGMFIAPGCNGIRGSITLGFLTLIFGYARRLRLVRLSCTTLAALVLGYALNLLRLCMLVVYYRIGLGIPAIQKYGLSVDYGIGCALFLCATLFITLALKPGPVRPTPPVDIEEVKLGLAATPTTGSSHYARAARSFCFFAFTCSFIPIEFFALHSQIALRPSEQTVLESFPATIGSYQLTRTWGEHDSNGTLVLAMGEYSVLPSNILTLGLWVGSANHLVAESKFIQGDSVQWTGSFDAPARRAFPVHFVTSFYDDGIRRQYDAESACSDTGCSVRLTGARHVGLFVRVPGFSDLLPGRRRRLPILIRRVWPDSDATPSAALRLQFEADVRFFLAQTDLQSLLLQDGSQL